MRYIMMQNHLPFGNDYTIKEDSVIVARCLASRNTIELGL